MISYDNYTRIVVATGGSEKAIHQLEFVLLSSLLSCTMIVSICLVWPDDVKPKLIGSCFC